MDISNLHARHNILQEPRNIFPKRSDAALKTYDSVTDPRAWSNDDQEKSKYIHEIVKQVPRACSLGSYESMAKEDLVNDIKAKDVELDKMHKLYKHTSRKLEDMNEIINDKRVLEERLKNSEHRMSFLKKENLLKEEKLKSTKQEIEELKCCSSQTLNVDEAWENIKNRADLYDQVVKERNELKNQLCKMNGIECVLKKLKARADQADCMEQEICCLKRELQRCGYGAAGDDSSKKLSQSGCPQCNQLAEDLSRSEAMLNCEIKRSNQNAAESNFLRERARASDVMEAELILYKNKYKECESNVKCLREMLVNSELNEMKLNDLSKELQTIKNQLRESELHASELINMIERLENDLKERDLYIESLNHRMGGQAADTKSDKKSAVDCVPKGKVQTIVSQMCPETKTSKTDECDKRCSKISPKVENSKCSGQVKIKVEKEDCNEIKSSSRQTDNVQDKKNESTQYEETETACNEFEILRQQNYELQSELERYKSELNEMTKVVDSIEVEKNSNDCLQNQKMKDLNGSYQQEVDALKEKICEIERQLEEKNEKGAALEKKLAINCKELEDLQPLRNLPECCKELKSKLKESENKCSDRSKEVEGLNNNCEEYKKEIEKMCKQICELEIDLNEQKEYAKSLATQLTNRTIRSSTLSKRSEESKENIELLKKCLREFKQKYDDLLIEKVDLITCFREKINFLETKIACLENTKNQAEKNCSCNRSSSQSRNNCGSLLHKAAKVGIEMLSENELSELHSTIRCAMTNLKKDLKKFSSDYYADMTKKICQKYNITNFDETPVKDVDACSSKTLPSILQNKSYKQRRARSSEHPKSSSNSNVKQQKCVTISRSSLKLE